jgi:hypothetical protein
MTATALPPVSELPDREAVAWLLASGEPAVRAMTHRDLIGRRSAKDEAAILDGSAVRALFAGQQEDGGFGGHPYHKWGGAHWRLVSLVELGIPAGEPRARAALDTVLAWLTGTRHVRGVPVIAGLPRRCGSQEGNALAVACRLGQTENPLVQQLATSLVGWQWPDGGWNCDRHADAHRSSFNESLPPMWGLHEYARATGDTNAADAADRAAELLLEHRLFRRLADGATIKDDWLRPHWPPYWHYESLQALVILARMGRAADPRAADALNELRAQREPDGRWRGSKSWWKPPASKGTSVEALDWRTDDLGDRMTTLRAMTVLRAASA